MRQISLLLCLLFLLSACIDLRSDYPLLPVAEYEKLIVGRFDADYIGNEQCLAKCHKHDNIYDDFSTSIHGEQIDAASGLPKVNCESCHGPGSLAVADIGSDNRCDTKKLLQLEELPAPAQSLICLKCHATASTMSLNHWNASRHALSGVSCSDCHKLHEGPQQKVSRKDMAELCYKCHGDVRMQFVQPSHHPVPENRMVCTDCHDPHGSTTEFDLRGPTVRDTCSRCHAEYTGPFVFEHGDITENCANCHRPHGSLQAKLLTTAQPFLCMQCHPTGAHAGLKSSEDKRIYFGRCTDCHSSIHGSDTPSARGRGTFIAR